MQIRLGYYARCDACERETFIYGITVRADALEELTSAGWRSLSRQYRTTNGAVVTAVARICGACAQDYAQTDGGEEAKPLG